MRKPQALLPACVFHCLESIILVTKGDGLFPMNLCGVCVAVSAGASHASGQSQGSIPQHIAAGACLRPHGLSAMSMWLMKSRPRVEWRGRRWGAFVQALEDSSEKVIWEVGKVFQPAVKEGKNVRASDLLEEGRGRMENGLWTVA